jgi:hypothetical protein
LGDPRFKSQVFEFIAYSFVFGCWNIEEKKSTTTLPSQSELLSMSLQIPHREKSNGGSQAATKAVILVNI